MGTNYTPDTLSGRLTATDINNELDRIHNALEESLSRLGASINTMQSDLDMNDNHIYNLPKPILPDEPIRKRDFEEGSGGGGGGASTESVVKVNSIIQLIYSEYYQYGYNHVYVKSFYEDEDTGGGHFYWNSGMDKSLADGGTIIDPDNVGGFSGSPSSLVGYFAAQGNGTGNGCWVRSHTSKNEYHVSWFGAVGDGAVDDTVAIQHTIDEVINILTSSTLPRFTHIFSVLGSGIYNITDTITVPKTDGVFVEKLKLYLNSAIARTWSGATGDPMFRLDAPNMEVHLSMDCNNTGASGIHAHQTFQQDYINPRIFHFNSYGMKFTGGGNGGTVQNCLISQFIQADPQYPNFTAPAIIVDANDIMFYGGDANRSNPVIRLDSGALAVHFHDMHIWGGFVQPPAAGVDPVLVEVNAGGDNYMHDCYFDGGYIDLYRRGLHVNGGSYAEGHSGIDSNIMRVYGLNLYTNPFFSSITNFNQRSANPINMFGVFPNPSTGETFEGDFSRINSYVAESNEQLNEINRIREVYPSTGFSTDKLIQVPRRTDSDKSGYVATYQIGNKDLVFRASQYGTIHYTTDGGSFDVSDNVNRPAITLQGGDSGIGLGLNKSLDIISDNTLIWTFLGPTTDLRPSQDGQSNVGQAAYRVKEFFAVDGNINTSDRDDKQQLRNLEESEKRVAQALRGKLKAFKWNKAVEEKGDDARWHFGIIAQEVAECFESEGLDPHRYGMFCYDEWKEEPEIPEKWGPVLDEKGVPTSEMKIIREAVPKKEAGSRYGVRYNELLAFIISAL